MSLDLLRFLGGVGTGVILGLCIAWVAVYLLTQPTERRPCG